MSQTRKHRKSPRKQTTNIRVSHLTSMNGFAKLAKNLEIIQASNNGLLLQVARANLMLPSLRKNLTLDSIHGDRVLMHIKDMEIDLAGVVARTGLNGKKGFYIAIDYTEDAPEYWGECLVELLPAPGEIEEH